MMLLYKYSIIFVYFYLKILNKPASCEEGSSLAFAIDDTGSMYDDIDQVRKEAKAILDVVLNEKSSEVKDFVLVSINDPVSELRIKTKSPEIFRNHLNAITVGGGGYCPEMSLTGIEKALLESRAGSYIFVFTDASAEDFDKVDTVKRLCQKKQSQVIFVLTGDCGYPSSKQYLVYYEIAAVSSGQVFRVNKQEVQQVLQPIKTLLGGKHSVVKSTVISPKPHEEVPVAFTIDDKVEYALISVSGSNVDLRIKPVDVFAPEPASKRIMWNSNAKVLKLFNPKPGRYFAYVRGTNSISVMVYVRTDFTFEHGFSNLEPKSIIDTSKQPLAGEKQYLSINVTDPDDSVEIRSAILLDMNDNAISGALPLRKIKDHLYITDLVSPAQMFKIKVQGVIKKTNEPIARISKTAVTPREAPKMPTTAPHVKISEGAETKVDYGTDLTLTCVVTAHPRPTITWLTAAGTQLPSESSELEKPSYISYLKLRNIKNDGIYACKAENSLGKDQNRIQVKVRPVFNVISVPGATTSAKYQDTIDIPCDIKSSLPITLKWSRSGRELRSDGKHFVSADGTKLTLRSMDFGMEGTYTCEATLNKEPTVKKIYNTDVKMTGLVPPQVTNALFELEGKRFTAICRFIGTPKPTITWQFKPIGADVFYNLKGSDEKFTITDVNFKNFGNYKCTAESRLGKAEHTLDFVVEEIPKTKISEGAEKYVEYGESTTLACKVDAYPTPKIAWLTSTGTLLASETSELEKPSYMSYLKVNNIKKDETYICRAVNKKGKQQSTIQVKVRPVFNVVSVPRATTLAKYQDTIDIPCEIKSSHPITLRWFRSGRELRSDGKYFISADGTRLALRSMNFGMEGTYTCEATLNKEPTVKKTYNTDVKMTGLVRPQVANAATELKGKRFKAFCRVIGTPNPTITWQFKPMKGDKFATIQESGGEEYTIPDVKLKDSGNYKCVVKSPLGEVERTLDLVVEEAPVITNPWTEYYGVVGDKILMIPCIVTGYPDPVITWTKETKTPENEFKYEVKGNKLYISSLVHTTEIIIFKCKAVNKLGTADKSFSVEISDNLNNYYDYPKHVYNVIEGNPVAIKCNVGNPEKRPVRWYLNGMIDSQTDIEYKIEKTAISNDGNYTCRVDTAEGTITENYELFVGFIPRFRNNAENIVDWHDNTTLLDCEVDSKPIETVEWLHNGNTVRSLSNKPTVDVTDWGNFTCIVTNVHGSIQRTFKVISSGCYIRNTKDQQMPFIVGQNTLTWPDGISNIDLLLKEHDSIKLSCQSGSKYSNTFRSLPSKDVITAQCVTQDKLIVEGKTYKYKELQCDKTVLPSISNTHEQCAGPGSEMIRVGFPVSRFAEAYTVCYDKRKNVPLYAYIPKPLTKLGTNHIDTSVYEWNAAPGLDSKRTARYNCRSKKCCYTKGQLLKVTDLPFGPAQAATFLENLNSVPVWNPCVGANRTSWETLVSAVKAEAINYDQWTYWTGASDYNTKHIGIVPRYLWTVINYMDGDETDGTAIVYVNDDSPGPNDIRCNKPCSMIVLPSNTDKFLYCCSLKEFSDNFGIPLEKLRNARNEIKDK